MSGRDVDLTIAIYGGELDARVIAYRCGMTEAEVRSTTDRMLDRLPEELLRAGSPARADREP